MHVLVVEDDPLIADHIVSGLKLGGHTARLAVTGADAARAIADGVYDAVVLDRMLPDINGLSVIDQVRAKGGAMPILMLSALGSVKNRIEGLQAGADDYLAKPFSMDELDARLQAIVRRGTPQAGKAILQIGALKLDVASHSVAYGASSMILNRKQYSLLAHLMHNADRIVTRTMLLEAVWSYSFSTTTNIVESNMSRLRTALQEIGCDPIDTQRGAGYVLRTERCT
ncbi:response regulator transcription factor [Novosphingobium resinovorum]|uniref:response regulator transcription factor n=1 Tax=Novosphingobium TaxID=165696 RepID=UPI001B3C74DA|nr:MULTISPECIES: response regulator transcription factor [Novosphingobium]MBF7014491.1 response regulator transcription factor [Novosphingobium sp. HR1a]WJM25028.1 response regulator transcription factor [Novosphingobium resinovorum]